MDLRSSSAGPPLRQLGGRPGGDGSTARAGQGWRRARNRGSARSLARGLAGGGRRARAPHGPAAAAQPSRGGLRRPGPALGQALWSGLALPHRHLPRAGELDAAEQYAYATRAGWWRTARQIGDAVTAGALLGTLGEVAVRAPIAGHVRGLVHEGVAV